MSKPNRFEEELARLQGEIDALRAASAEMIAAYEAMVAYNNYEITDNGWAPEFDSPHDRLNRTVDSVKSLLGVKE